MRGVRTTETGLKTCVLRRGVRIGVECVFNNSRLPILGPSTSFNGVAQYNEGLASGTDMEDRVREIWRGTSTIVNA